MAASAISLPNASRCRKPTVRRVTLDSHTLTPSGVSAMRGSVLESGFRLRSGIVRLGPDLAIWTTVPIAWATCHFRTLDFAKSEAASVKKASRMPSH